MSSEPTPEPGEPASEHPPDPADAWRTSLLMPVVIIAIVVGLIAAMIFVAQQQQDEGGAVLVASVVDPATLPVTVPYRDVAGAIVIDVTLGEDSRTVPMILDTGAPTIVSEELAEVFAGDTRGTIATSSADGATLTSDIVAVPRLAIGSATFHDVGAVVDRIDPGNPFYCLSDAGFIGASLMRSAVWQIDPTTHTLTITASADDLDHIDGATVLEFRPASAVSPSPLVELPAGEGSLTFLLDTGSDGWLATNPADLEDVGIAILDDAPSMAVLGSGAAGPVLTQARWVDATTGDDSLLLAASESMPQGQGNAGTDYLSRFVVTLDWPAGVVYLDPIADVAPSVPSSAALGWDDGFVVGSYVEGLAGNEGLELGARVQAIEGQDVTRAPFDDFCRRLIDGPATFEMTMAGEGSVAVSVAPVDGFYAPLGEQPE